MQEYGNYYSKEDIGWVYPSENYEVLSLIRTAQQKFPTDRMQQRNWVEERIKSYFWPDEESPLELLEYAGLADKTKSAMKSRGVYSENVISISSSCRVVVKAFYEDTHMWFYWWDRYLNGKISSAIEFFPWNDHPASYVLFATDAQQSPLLCTKPFVDAQVRKYTRPN